MKKISSLSQDEYIVLLKQEGLKLTDSELKLTDYIQSHFNELIYFSIIDLARNTGLSKVTIGRYLNKLGFTGYTEFKRVIEKGMSDKKISPPIDVHSQNKDNLSASLSDLKEHFAANIMELLNTFNHQLDLNALDKFISLLTEKKRKIFVVGPSSSLAMATHFSTLLKYFRDDVFSLSIDTGELPKQMLHISEKDILIVFSYYRFNNVALDITKWFKQKNANIVIITNSISNPYARFANLQFILPSKSNAIFQSRIIGFYFIELLLHLYYERTDDEGNFQLLEELFQHFRVFSA